jgi:hypothetical protein
MYIENVIGRNTVNTVPCQTLAALMDHGRIVPDTVETELGGAHAIMAELARLQISPVEVGRQLQDEGVHWLGDQTPGFSATREFVQRRIDNVMQIEDVKAKIARNPLAAAVLKGPQRLLDRIRPPGDTAPSDLPGSLQRES